MGNMLHNHIQMRAVLINGKYVTEPYQMMPVLLRETNGGYMR